MQEPVLASFARETIFRSFTAITITEIMEIYGNVPMGGQPGSAYILFGRLVRNRALTDALNSYSQSISCTLIGRCERYPRCSLAELKKIWEIRGPVRIMHAHYTCALGAD